MYACGLGDVSSLERRTEVRDSFNIKYRITKGFFVYRTRLLAKRTYVLWLKGELVRCPVPAPRQLPLILLYSSPGRRALSDLVSAPSNTGIIHASRCMSRCRRAASPDRHPNTLFREYSFARRSFRLSLVINQCYHILGLQAYLYY